MKNIVESEETFEAYARIDCAYYCLKDMYKILSAPRSPIEMMVDDVTGYGDAKLKETKEVAIGLIEQIIKDKEFLGADCTKDKEILEKLKI